MKTESGFQLRKHRIIKSHFSISESFNDENGSEGIQLEPQLSLNFERLTDEGDIVVFFSIKILNENAPFKIDLVLGGEFHVTGEAIEKESVLERLVHINCAACLFPFMRETIADITRRGGFPSLYLPSMNFVEFYENSLEKDCKESLP